MKTKTKFRKNNWHDHRLGRKTTGRKKNILSVIFLLLAIVLGGLSIKIYSFLNNKVWDGKHRINIIVYGKEFSLITFSPEEKSFSLISLPNNLNVEAPGGYGKFSLTAIPKLAEFEKKNNLVLQTVQENLMVPVDGYILMESDKSLSGSTSESTAALFFSSTLTKNTNLKPWDLIRLWIAVREVNQNHFSVYALTEESVLKEEILPDKAKVYSLLPDKSDLFIQKYFTDLSIRTEQLSIGVLNGTVYPSLAQRFSRLITNIGGRVVSLGNGVPYPGLCLIEGSKSTLRTYTVTKIKNIFGCQVQISNGELKSDIVVNVGDQYWSKLYSE